MLTVQFSVSDRWYIYNIILYTSVCVVHTADIKCCQHFKVLAHAPQYSSVFDTREAVPSRKNFKNNPFARSNNCRRPAAAAADWVVDRKLRRRRVPGAP